MTHRARLEALFDAWRAGDALRAAAAFAPHAEYREAKREPVTGRDDILAHFVRFFRDGPPFEFDVDCIVVEGDRAAVGYRFALLPDGALRRESSGCALVRFGDGTIIEWREYEG